MGSDDFDTGKLFIYDRLIVIVDMLLRRTWMNHPDKR
jgi:hypothetical protein